jgi:hypothetical protein
VRERLVALGLGGVLDTLLVLRGRQDRDVLEDADGADAEPWMSAICGLMLP